MAKATKFHEMKNEELSVELRELKERLFRLRFSAATGQLQNPQEMTHCKKDIARVKTVMHERQIKANAKGERLSFSLVKPSTKKVKASKATAKAPAKPTEKAAAKTVEADGNSTAKAKAAPAPKAAAPAKKEAPAKAVAPKKEATPKAAKAPAKKVEGKE